MVKHLIKKLSSDKNLEDGEFTELLETEYDEAVLFSVADSVRKANYGTEVYLRGLIEFSNCCKNNCYYCGIRAGNQAVQRYRLTVDEILECCAEGYGLGYRTFVLQSGEDVYYTDDLMCRIVSAIKHRYPGCAVTLSLGERSFQSYRSFFDAGADRYLLRHETANEEHYGKLHPGTMSLAYRKECLFELKKIGYQVGAGFMVGSPFQTTGNLIEDLRFLQELKPDMIGIGPFLTASNTPFQDCPNGSLKTTLRLIAILRLMFPCALIPATTALGTIHPMGREMGLKAGANVVMPNLSPVKFRKSYGLYDNKICTGEESAQCISCLEQRVEAAGYHISQSRGDVKKTI